MIERVLEALGLGSCIADPRFQKGFGQDTSEKVDHCTTRVVSANNQIDTGLYFRTS